MDDRCHASRNNKHRWRISGNEELGIKYYECGACGEKREIPAAQPWWWGCGHAKSVPPKSSARDAPELVCPECGCEWREGVWVQP